MGVDATQVMNQLQMLHYQNIKTAIIRNNTKGFLYKCTTWQRKNILPGFKPIIVLQKAVILENKTKGAVFMARAILY